MKKMNTFYRTIIFIIGILSITWAMSSCSESTEDSLKSGNEETVPITFLIGDITENEINTRGVTEPVSFVQEIGKGHFMETSIVPESSTPTRAPQSLDNGVKCRMLIYRNSISPINFHKTIEFSVGSPISVDLPINANFKVVCYSYNSTTIAPAFSLAPDNTVNDISVTANSGLVNDFLRSEDQLITNDNGGTFTIQFKHVFSRAKLQIGTTVSGQRISSCTASIDPIVTSATFSPSTGNVVKNNNGTATPSFNFPVLNTSPIESDFINIIVPSGKPTIKINQISFTGEQIVGNLDFTGLSFTLPQPLAEGKSYRIIQNYNTGTITYRYNDNQSGVIMPNGQTIRFTFYNPFNDPFTLDAYEIINGQKVSIVTTPSTTGLTKDITIPTRNATLGNRFIYFRYTNTTSGKTYETGVQMTQRGSTQINIMTMGEVQIYNATWEQTNPTTYISTRHAYNGYTAGLRPLLENKTLFGPSGKVPYSFKFFNLMNFGNTDSQVGRNYDLRQGTTATVLKSTKQVLEENNIDILCIYWDVFQTPTPDQVQQVLDWLTADPHRGLIFSFDYYKYYGEASTAVGTTFGSSSNSTNHWLLDGLKLSDVGQSGRGGGTANFHLLSPGDIGYNDTEYGKIVDYGAFGSVRGVSFRAVDNDYGWVTQSLANREGYVPILLDGNNRTVMAVHPTKRIFFHGELQFLEAVVMGSSGDVNFSNAYGSYAKLMGNAWAWFVERVVMGEKYE